MHGKRCAVQEESSRKGKRRKSMVAVACRPNISVCREMANCIQTTVIVIQLGIGIPVYYNRPNGYEIRRPLFAFISSGM